MSEILARHKRWLWVREQGPDGPREHPVYLDPRLERQIEGYFALMEARPDAFTPPGRTPLPLRNSIPSAPTGGSCWNSRRRLAGQPVWCLTTCPITKR